MGPKQTAPQGDGSTGGQEGQKGPQASNGGATPVFSLTGSSSTSNSPLAGPSVTSPNEPGTLGADTLSTGANVSRTMDNLNSREQSTHGGLAFAKHRFDKIDPKTGDILLTPDEGPKKKGFFAGLFGAGRKKAPESVSMVENRHKDVVIPAEYQNPGRKAAQAAVTPTQPASAPTQPVASPSEPKKSRKGIIIALAGVAVVAVAVVAVVLVTNVTNRSGNQSSNTANSGGSSSGGSNIASSESSVRELANTYINTVLFNNPSTLTSTAPYFTNMTYYLRDLLLGKLSTTTTIAEKQEFLEHILELYDEFSDAFNNSIYINYPTTVKAIDDYGENLRNYVDYYTNPELEGETLYTVSEENVAINNIVIGCWTITENLDNPIKSNVDSSMYVSETNGNGVSQ